MRTNPPILPLDDGRRAAALASARAHSLVVKALKATCAASLAGWAAYGIAVSARPSAPRVQIAEIGVASDGRIRMESPVMTGVRKDGRPYRVAARETVEDVGGGGDMEMTGVSATLNTDGARLDVTSNSGFYSKARETMRLHGDVVFRTSANAMLTASDADIGFKDNSLHATGGPVVVAEGRTTDADAVDMLDNGDHVVFTGNVHSTVAGSPGDPAPPGAEPPVAGAAAGGTATAAPAADTPAGAARGNDAGAAAPAEQPRHEDRARKNAAARARKKPPRAARPPKRPFGL